MDTVLPLPMAYRLRGDPRNGPGYHTGELCIVPGCRRPAGTWWSPLWCFEHNVERMDRIVERYSPRAGLASSLPDPE
jgi:hypothetical protein